MRMSFDVRMTGLRQAENKVRAQAKKVLWKAMNKMQEIAIRKVPVDTGLLKSTIKIFPQFEGASEYILADGVEYGYDIEMGNRPHKVSWEPIEKWVKRKGIGTTKDEIFLITKYVVEKIRTKGVNSQPFFRPSLLEVENIWLPQFWVEIITQS